MYRLERRRPRQLPGIAWLLAAAACQAGAADEPPYRYRAPVSVVQPGAFIELPLPASAYAHSLARTPLDDLRLLDADGARVPFALLPPPPSTAAPAVAALPVRLYPLPPQARSPEAATLALELRGGQVRIRPQRGSADLAATSTSPVPGWVVDLGAPAQRAAALTRLTLRWSGPAAFSAPFELAHSADLQHWQAGEGGQLMALASASGPLAQPHIALPPGAPRFLRLRWLEPASAPALTAAELTAPATAPGGGTLPLTWLTLPAQAEPTRGQDSAGALIVDLGGALPVVQLDLDLGGGNRVVPLRVQGRRGADEPWRDIGQGVFYRLERGTQVSRSPAWVLDERSSGSSPLRQLRLLPDGRAAALEPAATRVRVGLQPAHLVFAAQGRAPYKLQAGAARVAPGALPVSTLVPGLEEERLRLGRATLGEWQERPEAAAQAAAAQRRAAWRPRLLWAVLLAGVAGLGYMVWRLATAAPSRGP